MKKPLNFAILKHLTKVKEASAEDVINALKDEYSDFKAFNKDDISFALMTAEKNNLIKERRLEIDKNNQLKIYYYAHKEGVNIINKYIKE